MVDDVLVVYLHRVVTETGTMEFKPQIQVVADEHIFLSGFAEFLPSSKLSNFFFQFFRCLGSECHQLSGHIQNPNAI